MLDNNLYVSITLDELKSLVKAKEQLHILTEALYEDASLSYNGKEIRFGVDSLQTFMKIFDKQRYFNILCKLKKEKESEDE